MKSTDHREHETRWRVTLVDTVSGQPIEIDVDGRDVEAAREAGWATLRSRRTTGLVVVDLVDVRPMDEPRSAKLPKEAADERDQGVRPPRRDQ